MTHDDRPFPTAAEATVLAKLALAEARDEATVAAGHTTADDIRSLGAKKRPGCDLLRLRVEAQRGAAR